MKNVTMKYAMIYITYTYNEQFCKGSNDINNEKYNEIRLYVLTYLNRYILKYITKYLMKFIMGYVMRNVMRYIIKDILYCHLIFQ